MSKPTDNTGQSENGEIYAFNQNQVNALVQKARSLENQLQTEREERDVAIAALTSTLEQSQRAADTLRAEVSKQIKANRCLIVKKQDKMKN